MQFGIGLIVYQEVCVISVLDGVLPVALAGVAAVALGGASIVLPSLVSPAQPVGQLQAAVIEVAFELQGVAFLGQALADGHGVPLLPGCFVAGRKSELREEPPIGSFLPGGSTPALQTTDAAIDAANLWIVNVRVQMRLVLAAGTALVRIVVLPIPIEAGREHPIDVLPGAVRGEAKLAVRQVPPRILDAKRTGATFGVEHVHGGLVGAEDREASVGGDTRSIIGRAAGRFLLR